MARNREENTGPMKARVLVDCAHGKCGAVVLVDPQVLAADADPATGLRELDASEAAVAYAEAEAARLKQAEMAALSLS